MEDLGSKDAASGVDSRLFPMRIPARIREEIFAEEKVLKKGVIEKSYQESVPNISFSDKKNPPSPPENASTRDIDDSIHADAERRVGAALAIVIVSSPSPVHPETTMLWDVLLSIDEHMPEFRRCPIVVVCDGYKVSSTFKRRNPFCNAKSGFILEDAARMYEGYKSCLRHELDLYGAKMTRECVLLDLCEHNGFAFGVKHGISYAKQNFSSTFALVLQHDRCFTDTSGVSTDCLLQSFADQPSIRYMGYPTKASIHYMQYQQDTFRNVWADVQHNLSVSVRAPGGRQGLALMPMMFWYDSNHIVHIDRMLELYTPFITVPTALHRHIGGKAGLKSMLMRKGDFIEDRLGQHQRNAFSALAEELIATAPTMKRDELLIKQQELDSVVSFFGCYLIVPVGSDVGVVGAGVGARSEVGGGGGVSVPDSTELESPKASHSTIICSRSLVMHLNGRSRPAPLIVSLLDL